MKKPKVKLDLSKVKTLLVQHVEKIVFGIFVLVLLYMTYAGFTLERFTQTPTELETAARNAATHVSSGTFDAKQQELVFVDPTETVKQNNVQINPTEFPLAPMNPPLFPGAGKRGEPSYLPVEELEVVAGSGTFRVKPQPGVGPVPAAGNTYAVRRWVAVLGLIPFERQRRAYHEQFAKHGGTEPEWVAYIVERAEVSGAPDAAPTWIRLNPKVATVEQTQWDNKTAEVVAAEFQVPLPEVFLPNRVPMPMLYPLGPLVGSTWRPEETTHSKILAILAAEAPPGTVPGAPAGDVNDADPAGAAVPAPPVAPVPAAADDDTDEFGGAARPAEGAAAGKPAAAAAVKPLRDMRAFRFFDFDVKPGKRYRYRVTLYFNNPNFGQATRNLADPKLAVGPNRISPPSAPSPEITVTHDAGVLVGTLIKARGANEIGVNLIVRQRDETNGSNVLGRRAARRGEQLNFRAGPEAEVTLVRPNNAAAERLSQYDFKTDTLVVDIAEIAAGQNAGQARVLLLGPDGRLSVQTEPTAAEAFATEDGTIKAAVPAPEPAAAAEPKNDREEDAPKRGTGGGSLLPPASTNRNTAPR